MAGCAKTVAEKHKISINSVQVVFIRGVDLIQQRKTGENNVYVERKLWKPVSADAQI
jgi:hypothetical protein